MSLSYYYWERGQVNFVFNKFYFLHSDIQDQYIPGAHWSWTSALLEKKFNP